MTGAGNQERAETVGLVPSIISVAQPWPELPAQMERFLELTFLVVRREKALVITNSVRFYNCATRMPGGCIGYVS